ncbi:MAG TPA: hypothetical protein VFQ61_19470 [Polyangiaceae bacterium]|nr:hypothetical protein [Polyangiaceae bacterium]
MAKAHTEWTVLPHESLEKLADNLWWVRGSLKGMSLKRTMVIARLADGRLVIHNGIALDEPSMKQLEAWGNPSFLVVPSGVHRLDAPAFKKRYPGLRVIAPRGARAQIEQVLPVDLNYDEFPADDAVRFENLQGVGNSEGVMIVNSSDGASVVLNDVVFNMDRKRDLLGFLFTTVMGSAPGPRVSRLGKLLLVKDKAALRADLERLAALPNLQRLIVAHEKVASGPEASDALRRAATYL